MENKILNERVAREKEFHNNRYAEEVRQPTVKYYEISKSIRQKYLEKIIENCDDQEMLELGCSKGEYSFKIASYGAKVVGIDISDVAIKQANDNLQKKKNLDVEFIVMSAEELYFNLERFDKIYGVSILHHIDFDKSMNKVRKILNANGKAIFIEPLGHNPFINLYRRLTPAFRSIDERPLKVADLQLFNRYFKNVNVSYYFLTTFIATPFRNSRMFKALVNILNSLDKILFKIKFMRKYAWQALIEVSNPIK